jgi:hypothetical protein
MPLVSTELFQFTLQNEENPQLYNKIQKKSIKNKNKYGPESQRNKTAASNK